MELEQSMNFVTELEVQNGELVQEADNFGKHILKIEKNLSEEIELR